MDKTLLMVVIFLGAFSLVKVIMFIAYSFMLKPKVDENGNFIRPVEKTSQEDDSWGDEDW